MTFLFPVRRRQCPSWTTSAACLTTWPTSWMQCWTDLLPASPTTPPPPLLSSVMHRCAKKTLLMLNAGALSVLVRVSERMSLQLERFWRSLAQYVQEGSPLWPDAECLSTRGGRSHTTCDLCSPASRHCCRRPAAGRCTHQEAQWFLSLHLCGPWQRAELSQAGRQTDQYIAGKVRHAPWLT